MTTETLSVPDISCDHCQRTIETALGRLPGVRAAVGCIGRSPAGGGTGPAAAPDPPRTRIPG